MEMIQVLSGLDGFGDFNGPEEVATAGKPTETAVAITNESPSLSMEEVKKQVAQASGAFQRASKEIQTSQLATWVAIGALAWLLFRK